MKIKNKWENDLSFDQTGYVYMFYYIIIILLLLY